MMGTESTWQRLDGYFVSRSIESIELFNGDYMCTYMTDVCCLERWGKFKWNHLQQVHTPTMPSLRPSVR